MFILPHLLFRLILLTLSCSIFYLLGFYRIPDQPPSLDSSHCPKLHLAPPPSSSLDFLPHHGYSLPLQHPSLDHHQSFPFCDTNFTDYCPCHDPSREMLFDTENKFFKERHCPHKDEMVRCLVPQPEGYRMPFRWPESREFSWFSNVPFTKLVDYKKEQNWVRLERDRLVFPGGGTTFRGGVKEYVDQIKKMVPLMSGIVRTVLDVGCGFCPTQEQLYVQGGLMQNFQDVALLYTIVWMFLMYPFLKGEGIQIHVAQLH